MVAALAGNNDFTPFELRINPIGTGDAYAVEAVIETPDGGSPRHVTGATLPRQLIGDMQRGMPPDRAGALLSEALYAGPIGEVLRGYAPDMRLRIRIAIEPGAEELQDLPWERLSDPRRPSDLLATQPDTPFARYLPSSAPPARIVRNRQLPMLCVIENPARFTGYDDAGGTAAVLDLVRAALRELAENDTVQITIWTPGEAPDEESQAMLAKEGFRSVHVAADPQSTQELLAGVAILHYQTVGVPYPAPDSEEPAAQYQQRVASVKAPDPTILTHLLRSPQVPPLIVLASSASHVTEYALGSPHRQTALDLIRHGAAAVAGLHDTGNRDQAVAVTNDFYRALLSDGIVDKALNQARAGLAKSDPRVPLPILWMSLPDGQLLVETGVDAYATEIPGSAAEGKPNTLPRSPSGMTYAPSSATTEAPAPPVPPVIDGTLVLREGPESPLAAGERFPVDVEVTNTGQTQWPPDVAIGWWTQADPVASGPVTPFELVTVKGSTGALASKEAVNERWEQPAPGPGKTTILWALFRGDQATGAVRIDGVEPVSATVEVLDAAGLLAHVVAQPTANTAGQQRRVEMAAHLVAQSAGADERRALVERILIPALTTTALTVQRKALMALVDAATAYPEIKENVRSTLASPSIALAEVQRLASSPQVAASARRWLQALLPATPPAEGPVNAAPTAETVRPPTGSLAGAAPATPAQPTRDILYVYDPPPPNRSLTIRVTSTSVEVDTSGKSYGGPSHLKDNAQDLIALRGKPADYGRRLFESILHTDPNPGLGSRTTTLVGYDTVHNEAAPELRIALALDANDLSLHEHAWEYLQAAGELPLAIRERSPFYRRLLSRTDDLTVSAPKVKVLAAISSPPQLGQPGHTLFEPLAKLDFDMERAILERALQRLRTADLIEYRIIGDAQAPLTLNTLREALEDGYHVLHLVAHGVYTKQVPPNNYYLVMDPGKTGQPLVSVEDFCTAMGQDLKLVVLASCRSAVAQTGDALRGLGPRLVQRGIPAVIAMQDYVSFETAQLFTQFFYDDLARSGRVDMAMAATRRALYQEIGPDKPDWGIPVLYMSADDGLLVEVNQTKARDLPKVSPDVRSYQQMGGKQDPRWEALRQAMQAQAMVMGAAQAATAFQRSVGAALGDVPSLAVRQDRTLLTERLSLAARLDAGNLARTVSTTPPFLELPLSTYDQVAAALNTGKHIILIGPPGTGKTSLAHAICAYAQAQGMCTGATMTTATADWTTFDTIGGYAPGADQTLQFKTGSFLDAIGKGEWLVIDEINRAEIDKAFGELFTVLSGQQVDLPYTVGANRARILPSDTKNGASGWIPATAQPAGFDYVPHPQWRIIGTMNVYDKSSLFSMSLAFMRRFAFIDIGLPADYAGLRAKWIDDLKVLDGAADLERQAFRDKLDRLLDTQDDQNVLMKRRALGPAIARDMLRYVAARYDARLPEPALPLLAEAIQLFAVPQLDGLDRVSIIRIYQRLRDDLAPAAEPGVLPRIRDLYPFIDDWESVPDRG